MFAKLAVDHQPTPATAQKHFHPCPGSGWPLFSVRAGAPLESALEHASNLLDSAHYVACQAANAAGDGEQSPRALWTIMHLVEAANAVIDASIASVEDGGD